MHGIPIIFTFWPGLPQLWLYGRWSGLLKAIVFAAFFNFVLYATFVQNGLVPKSGLIGCWIGLGLIWTLAIFQNDWAVKEFAQDRSQKDNSEESNELFVMAQSEYLQGNMDEAENLFERIVWLEPEDLDARLYLATIYRHRGRLHQAARQLDVIEKQPEVSKWHFQIEDERRLISELESELSSHDSETAGDSNNPLDELEDTLVSENPSDDLRRQAA